MMPIAQVIWIGLSASLFAIWVIMLCGVRRALVRATAGQARSAFDALRLASRDPAGAALCARLGGLTLALLLLNGLGLLLWPL